MGKIVLSHDEELYNLARERIRRQVRKLEKSGFTLKENIVPPTAHQLRKMGFTATLEDYNNLRREYGDVNVIKSLAYKVEQFSGKELNFFDYKEKVKENKELSKIAKKIISNLLPFNISKLEEFDLSESIKKYVEKSLTSSVPYYSKLKKIFSDPSNETAEDIINAINADDEDGLITEGDLVLNKIFGIIEGNYNADPETGRILKRIIDDSMERFGNENVLKALSETDEELLETIEYVLKYEPATPLAQSFFNRFEAILSRYSRDTFGFDYTEDSDFWSEKIRGYKEKQVKSKYPYS